MIQLYSAGTSASVLQGMTRNGDYLLKPTSCVLHQILNGVWSLEMQTPLDGTQTAITVNSVIRAPGPSGDQLYRVYEVTPAMDFVTTKAEPIFMQAAQDVFLLDVRPTNRTCQQALTYMINNQMSAGSYTYSGTSNITSTNTAYFVRKNLIEAIQGDGENTVLKRWGGEIYYDNFNISIRTQQGADRGVRVSFGVNMASCRQTVNTSEVITRIVPVGFNGYMIPAVYVDSPLISNYPFVRTKVINYPDIKLTSDLLMDEEAESYDTLAELQAALEDRANREFIEGKVDLPKVTYDVQIANIQKAPEYQSFTGLLDVRLGDTVHCFNQRLGITTDARAVEIYWDCCTETVSRVVLGDYTGDYFSQLSKVSRAAQTVIDTDNQQVRASRVAGILNAMQTQLRLQNTAAERSDVRAILFEDTDSASELYGAMSIGTQGFEIANSVVPGAAADSGDWDWKTFGTAAGFSADLIIAGVLASQNYTPGVQGVAIDLNTGTLYAPQFQINLQTNSDFQGLQDDLLGLSDDLSDLNAYFRFGTWGDNDTPGAAVVVPDTGNMVLVTADSVRLITGMMVDDPVAQLNQQELQVTDGVFSRSMSIGDYKWIPRTNGHLSLVYTG